MDLLELPRSVELARLYAGFTDDFFQYTSGDLWTLVATDSGTAALADAANGQILLNPSDGTVADNDEVYLRTTKECFKFAAGLPAIFEVCLKFTEANTDDANVAVGFMDAVAANSILDNGAGPAASYSGAVFFKVDGGTTWSVENSDGATQKTTALDGTQERVIGSPFSGTSQAAGGGVFQRLRIEFRPKTTTKADFLFFVDGVPVAKHVDQPFASATEACAFIGVKNGGANNEAVYLDYALAFQKRQ